MNHNCLYLPSRSWYSFTDPGGIEGWVGLGWLVGYILKWKLNPDTVIRLSTNRARRRLTSLIEANTLTTTPDHHHTSQLSVTSFVNKGVCLSLAHDRYRWSLADLLRSNINLSNFSFADSCRNSIGDKMKQVALFLYEMLCIQEGVFFKFCLQSNFFCQDHKLMTLFLF